MGGNFRPNFGLLSQAIDVIKDEGVEGLSVVEVMDKLGDKVRELINNRGELEGDILYKEIRNDIKDGKVVGKLRYDKIYTIIAKSRHVNRDELQVILGMNDAEYNDLLDKVWDDSIKRGMDDMQNIIELVNNIA